MTRYRVSSLIVQGANAKPIITVPMPRAFSRDPSMWESEFFDLLRAAYEVEHRLDNGESVKPGSREHDNLTEAIDQMGLQARW